MKIRIAVSLVVSALVMFLSLFVTTNFIGGNDGMGMLLLLFFVVYPILSVALGIVSGKEFKKLFFIPILNGVFYLVAAWAFLEFLESSFILYAVAYIGIGIIVSLITHAILNKKKTNSAE